MSKLNLTLCFALSLATACSKSSTSSGGEEAVSAEAVTVKGSLKSVSGRQSELNQWIVATVERDTGISHSGVINIAGNFTIEGVDNSVPQTLILLDPQYRFSSVLSYAGLEQGKIRQYFRISGSRLPNLVHNGPIINFTDFSSVDWEKNQANDANENLIPDVMEGVAALALTAGSKSIDTDSDLLFNEKDGDIDGDGLPNWFDPDDDGDGLVDPFDGDANGDEIADISQDLGDQYFNSLVKFLSLQLDQEVQADRSMVSNLVMTLKLEDGEKSSGVRIRGSGALINDGQALRFDQESGDAISQLWDKNLLDDGLNEDGEAEDGMFARRVQLSGTLVPKGKQVFFFEVAQGTGDARVLKEFPFTFPSLNTSPISGTCENGSRKITLVGTPFGVMTNYRWSVHVYDAAGIKVFASEPIDGSVANYTLPASATDRGGTYTARLVATALDRIPSFPSWVVRSASFNLSCLN